MSLAPQLAINQFTTMPQSFEEDLSLYESLGVQSIELCEKKLADDDAAAATQLQQVHDKGFAITSVQPAVHSPFPDRMASSPEEPDDRMARFRRTIDRFHTAFQAESLIYVAISGRIADYDFRRGWRVMVEQFQQLADYAADRNGRIAFEMLHPVLMNVDSFVCSIGDARRLVEEVDRKNFGLVFDVWHLWPQVDPAVVKALADHWMIAHLSDWPTEGPRHVDDRLVPGRGSIDLSCMLQMLCEAGYIGDYALEILSNKSLPDSLWQADPSTVIKQSQAGFTAAWAARSTRAGAITAESLTHRLLR